MALPTDVTPPAFLLRLDGTLLLVLERQTSVSLSLLRWPREDSEVVDGDGVAQAVPVPLDGKEARCGRLRLRP